MKTIPRQSSALNSTFSYLESFHWKQIWMKIWNRTKYIWNIKKIHFLNSRHRNLMNQSCNLSLILCQNVQWVTGFLSHSFPEIPTLYKMTLNTINKLFHEKVDQPRKWRANHQQLHLIFYEDQLEKSKHERRFFGWLFAFIWPLG